MFVVVLVAVSCVVILIVTSSTRPNPLGHYTVIRFKCHAGSKLWLVRRGRFIAPWGGVTQCSPPQGAINRPLYRLYRPERQGLFLIFLLFEDEVEGLDHPWIVLASRAAL